MRKILVNRDRESGIQRLDRREFIVAGLALTAASMLSNIVTAAPTKQPYASARR